MIDLEIIYEDNHLIAINKPNGYLVHADKTGDVSLEMILKGYLKEKYQKPGNVFLQSCHRLDRPVSGVLIFAKTSKGIERMRKLFAEKKVAKTYLALAEHMPEPPEGHLKNMLLKDRTTNVVHVVATDVPGAVIAETIYKTLGQVDRFFLVRLHPVTGRSHQLRVHMSHIGSPIYGDVKYGGPPMNNPSSLMLHCRQMEFEHPVQNIPLVLKAELPDIPVWSRLREEIHALEIAE